MFEPSECAVIDDRRVLGYTPEQIYNVVVDVAKYSHFIPYVQQSRITSQSCQNPNNPSQEQFQAVLTVHFGTITEEYESLVTHQNPRFVQAEAKEANHLFHELINEWKLTPKNDDTATEVHFSIRFKFTNQIFQSLAENALPRLVHQMTQSFEDRCRQLYGPPNQETELRDSKNAARELLKDSKE